MAEAEKTTDHAVIRKWAEERGGRPALVRRKAGEHEEGGILRLDFGEADASLEEIGWDEFFSVFEENGLALLHQDKTADGKQSRFNKLVRREDDGGDR